MTRWAQEVQYIPDEGRVELRFAYSILPYLSLLQREFTTYKLRHVAEMTSTHGVRLYELLAQWRQSGERELKIDEIRRMFGVTGKYKAIKDLKKYVIEPAIRDVNECSDLTVEWGQRKAGRKVAAIQFKFKPKAAKKEAGAAASTTDRRRDGRITRAEIERRARPGETYEDAERRLETEERQTSGGESGAAPAPTQTERRDEPEQVAGHIQGLWAAIGKAGNGDGE